MKKLILLSGLATFGASSLFATDGNTSSDKAKASVLIVNPLKVTKSQDMWFGEYILDPTLPGAKGILLEAQFGDGPDVNTYHGLQKWGNKAGFGNPHTARFNITGEKNYTCLVKTPKEITLTNTIGGPNANLTLNVTCTDDSQLTEITGNNWRLITLSAGQHTEALNGTGEAKFYVGGSLVLPEGSKPGWYRGEFQVSVEYN